MVARRVAVKEVLDPAADDDRLRTAVPADERCKPSSRRSRTSRCSTIRERSVTVSRQQQLEVAEADCERDSAERIGERDPAGAARSGTRSARPGGGPVDLRARAVGDQVRRRGSGVLGEVDPRLAQAEQVALRADDALGEARLSAGVRLRCRDRHDAVAVRVGEPLVRPARERLRPGRSGRAGAPRGSRPAGSRRPCSGRR